MANNSKQNKNNRRGNNGGGHRTKLTPQLLGKFLSILADNGGIVSDACKAVGVARRSIYDKRDADPQFKADWEQAVDRGVDILEDEAKRRAAEGTEEPIFYQGEIVATIKKKSDYLMALLLKGHRTRYKERHELTGPDGQPLSSEVTLKIIRETIGD